MSIASAESILRNVVTKTPLKYNRLLSEAYGANVYLKREDLQKVRSYKLRGAYVAIHSLSQEQKDKGVICSSAGNHAQGVAFACNALGIYGHIFMPKSTPIQKVQQVVLHGGDRVKINLVGDTFDETKQIAIDVAEEQKLTMIDAFNDMQVIEGQGTVAKEVFDDLPEADCLIVPVGGGGLLAGCVKYREEQKLNYEIIPVEATGAPTLHSSLEAGHLVTLRKVNTFADGTAVKRIGNINFEIINGKVGTPVLVPEGKICTQILELYNQQAIVAEPSGALSIAALSFIKDKIKGKTVVCVVSGGNNDIDRMSEIIERSLIYEGLKHYLLIEMPQRAGALKEFILNVMGPNDDIARFEYVKKNSKGKGNILLGVEVKTKEDFILLKENMRKFKFEYLELNKKEKLFNFIV